MLTSLVVFLKPEYSGSLPGTTGLALHGSFFKWLGQTEPELATELHALNTLKPFTVSPLQRGRGEVDLQPVPAEIPINPRDDYWFRLTSLETRLSEVLLEKFYREPPARLEILSQRFKVQRVAATSNEHPWAATSSYDDLEELPRLSNGKVRLLFHSPTTFKSAGRAMAVPLPTITFNSLANRWNSFSNRPLDPALTTYFENEVGISGYQLQTELAFLEGSARGPRLLAFKGWCEYTSFAPDPQWSRYLHRLARFAFFSGVGYKTAMGFGQTVPLIEARK